MADIPVFQLVPSKGHLTIGDCGICALATICDKAYEDVVAAATQLIRGNWKTGLFISQMVKIAAHFGVTLKRRRKYDLETACGILDVEIKEPDSEDVVKHAVIVMDGRIYDSDLRVWAVDAFQRHYRARFLTLLEVQ